MSWTMTVRKEPAAAEDHLQGDPGDSPHFSHILIVLFQQKQ